MKKITPENVLKADSIRYKLNFDNDQFEPMSIEDYIKIADEIVIGENVPEKLKKLITEAKDLFVYGYTKHSFFTLATEKIIFAFEAAMEDKYKKVKGPKRKLDGKQPNLEFMITYLIEEGYIETKWETPFKFLRHERNAIAHSKDNRGIEIADLTVSYTMIEFIVQTINSLYKE